MGLNVGSSCLCKALQQSESVGGGVESRWASERLLLVELGA